MDKPRKTVIIPDDLGEKLKAAVRPLFAFLRHDGGVVSSSDGDGLPPGWIQLGTDERGNKIFGHISPSSPTFRFDDFEDMKRRGLRP